LPVAVVLAAGCAAYDGILPFSVGEARPYRDEKADAEFKQARDYIADLEHGKALAILPGVVKAYQQARNPERAGEAAFWTGFCNEKLDRIGEARKFYDLVLAKYPETRAARQAAERLPRLKSKSSP
jgi:hypothetical protein